MKRSTGRRSSGWKKSATSNISSESEPDSHSDERRVASKALGNVFILMLAVDGDGQTPCSRYALILALAASLGIGFTGCGKKTPPAPPPPEVLVTDVQQRDVPIYNEYVGQLDASVNATIEARVQGYLISQNYKEGQLVKKGDVLFQ